MAKIRYVIQYTKVDKKTGKMANTGTGFCTDIVEAESEISAIAKVKANQKAFNINVVSIKSRN
jgi:hypothetical protein